MKSRGSTYLLAAIPAAFLLLFFALPIVLLLSTSVLKSEDMVPVAELTTSNFSTLLTKKLYIDAIIRTLGIGVAVGALVVVLGYPLAYALVRTQSRWQPLLVALALSPLLASVIVRTYGWWVLLNREGPINDFLLALGIISTPLRMLPSTAVIIVGLTHALLPYGVLTLMAALNGVNPNLERAAMSLGAGRVRTFISVTLPLTASGVIGGFLLAFGVAIGAYATPAILGGPGTQTMATLIYSFMMTLLDWSLGSAMGVILLASSFVVLTLTMLAGRRERIMSHKLLWGIVAMIYAFMLTPILITAAVSFNKVERSYFPPRGFSLHWWSMAMTPQWTGPFLFSLKLAALSAVATAVLGLPLALALRQPTFRGRGTLQALTLGPLVLPSLVTGIALLQGLTLAGVGNWIGLPALIIGHVVICLPFMVRTLSISLGSIPLNAEIAAASLGASRARVLLEVTLPLARSGGAAGMIFAFISSFDDINLALFVARPGQTPLTVQIMQFLEYGFSPTLAALSIISLLVPLVLVALFGRLVGIGDFIYQDHGHA